MASPAHLPPGTSTHRGTPVTVLRGRLQGLAEGVFQPGEVLFRSLLTQAEGLTRLIEDLRVINSPKAGI